VKKSIAFYLSALFGMFILLMPLHSQAGLVYWNLFNIEGESSLNSDFVTYNTLEDMLHDTNRTSVVAPGSGFGRNIVGTGSDGNTYWNLFNIEGESSLNSDFVTYNTLEDMLHDTNRTSVVAPGSGFGRNIVGSGASIIADTPPMQSIPEPTTVLLFFLGLICLGVREKCSAAQSILGSN
jgi:hypothetical protein